MVRRVHSTVVQIMTLEQVPGDDEKLRQYAAKVHAIDLVLPLSLNDTLPPPKLTRLT